jgi:hypothetical protein
MCCPCIKLSGVSPLQVGQDSREGHHRAGITWVPEGLGSEYNFLNATITLYLENDPTNEQRDTDKAGRAWERGVMVQLIGSSMLHLTIHMFGKESA